MSLSNKVKTAVMALTIAVAGAGVFLAPAYAAECNCSSQTRTDGTPCSQAELGMCAADPGGGNSPKLEVTVTNIINGVLYVIGILAVVMVIIGGVKYTTSGGDQAAVTSAKNTILYGIIGLVIAILAYAIVNFVISRVTASNNNVLVGPPVSV